MTAIELPEKYDGWVEAPTEGTEVPRSEYLLVQIDYFGPVEGGKRSGPNIDLRRFVPPKPKPTLPEVKYGAVLDYTDKAGRRCRAMCFGTDGWRVYTYAGELRIARSSYSSNQTYFTDADLLSHVDANGFAIVSEGL